MAKNLRRSEVYEEGDNVAWKMDTAEMEDQQLHTKNLTKNQLKIWMEKTEMEECCNI